MSGEPVERPLSGGFSNVVVQVGRTVRRDTGPWTEAVHGLLRHLDRVGFRYSPRVLGIDEQGREILSFIDGKTAWWPWPAALWTDDGLRSVARMVRELGAAVASFSAPAGTIWHGGPTTDPALRIRHGDLAPWNTVWADGELVGLIDWDTAEPAPPLWDVAQAAWYFVPLRAAGGYQSDGFPTFAEQRHRFGEWCEELDVEPAAVLSALRAVQAFERDRIAERGGAGIEPYAKFLARGDVAAIDAERAWLDAHHGALLAD
ncbi:MAG TPA: aminoglycoside phosphotransferase family protein [Mycobacteriales bacterium]|nr:aminoglycoside phosphotransferase family protein [Mycobacteriales bacterium]